MRDVEIKALVREALSDRLDSFTLLARGIALVCVRRIEGYAAYRAEDLVKGIRPSADRGAK